ncbi:MAG: riboflavin synthase subunit alpha [bacterium]
MFTGIVQALVRVQHIDDQGDLVKLTLDMGGMTDGLVPGASVAVNGTCLTVTRVDQASVTFDIIVETLRTTNLHALAEGVDVNVERSFKVGDEIGGHVVSGHVTTTAELVNRHAEGNEQVLTFSVAPQWMKYIFHKGFIALDGASLTVSSVDKLQHQFQVSLIPETLARTTLGRAARGARINVEVDAQTVTTVETVERLFADPAWRAQIADQ